MGWVGASDRALGKYARVLADWGYPSVRSVVPTAYVLCGQAGACDAWAQSMLDFMHDQGLVQGRPLVLYAFSNGGAAIVASMARICRSEDRCANHVCGVPSVPAVKEGMLGLWKPSASVAPLMDAQHGHTPSPALGTNRCGPGWQRASLTAPPPKGPRPCGTGC